MLSEVLAHLEHAHLVLAAEYGPKLVIRQNLSLVLRVLEVVRLDVRPTLLTTSVRGSGVAPTTAASSFDGCSGFARAGFGFLAALASVIVILLNCAALPSAAAKGRDHGQQELNTSLIPL